MRIDFSFGRPGSSRRRDDGSPARLLVLADLHPTNAPARVIDRPIVRVDIDNIGQVLARCAPSATLPAKRGGERLEFGAFDDFHPDALVKRERLFGRLTDLRRRLRHPDTFAAAAAELRAGASPEAVPQAAPALAPAPARADREDLPAALERLLGGSPDKTPPRGQPRAENVVDNLIRQAVAPYVVAAADPRMPELVSAVDAAMSDVMRGVLHDPGVQEIEATWRGIHWLVSSLELGETLELHLLHVTRGELSSGAAAGSDLYRRLVDKEAQTAGGLRPAAIVGAYRFDATADDLALLESMGALARAVGAPFVAECGASLLGARGVAQQPDPRDWTALEAGLEARWHGLRAGPAAPYLGLALPRILLRLPYGRKADPIETFTFEELPPEADHEAFLWGNAAFACALVMARELDAEEEASDAGSIAGLPAFTFDTDEGPRLQPCAEVCLTERAIGAVLARGIMPLVSVKDADEVRLVRLQSIADPPTALLR